MAEQIVVSEVMQVYLETIRYWTKFLAAVGLCTTALLVLIGLLMFLVLPEAPASSTSTLDGPLFAAVYVVLTVFVILIPSLLLSRYAKAISNSSLTEQLRVETALMWQKSFWKYFGVFTVILIAVFIFLVVDAVAVGMADVANQ